jgi:hypothetical protein
MATASYNPQLTDATLTNVVVTTGPSVATAAAATPSPVTGTSTALSVLGSDSAGQSSLTYTWSYTGPTGVTYSGAANGTNAAQNITARFNQAGTYTFLATITDSSGLTATSGVTVTVLQTPTGVTVTPTSGTSLVIGQTQQFAASVTDQFGATIASPTLNWSATGGTVNSTGLFTAGQSSGNFSVSATAGSVTGTATGTVSLPTWLGSGSVATWNPSTQVLTVTGAASIIADPGTDEPIIEASGSAAVVTLDPATGTDIHLGGLSLTDGASATVTSLGLARTITNYHLLVIGTPGATVAPTYTIDSTSTLDLADNDMAILYGSGTSPLLTVQSELSQAYDNKAWDKPGLTSSVAKGSSGVTALGLGEASTLGLSTFDGLTLGGNAVLVKYTLTGDANLDGTVNFNDFSIVQNNYNQSSVWSGGDFNYDGITNFNDFSLLQNNYGQTLANVLPDDAASASQTSGSPGGKTGIAAIAPVANGGKKSAASNERLAHSGSARPTGITPYLGSLPDRTAGTGGTPSVT